MRAALAGLIASLLAPAHGTAQGTHARSDSAGTSVEALVAAARAGTARYQDRDAAIADGYRAIGPDAPGMGQHWVNPRLLLVGVFDPVRPQVLNYVVVDGRPVLAGVAYAIPTHGANDAPAVPMGQGAWHFHAGTIDEEGFLPDHHGAGSGPGADTRLAVLHAWVWVDNPAGMFEPDNWALPFRRLGFAPPAGAGADAGRALSLATVGEPFFLRMIGETGHPDSIALRRIAEALATRAGAVRAWAAERAGRSLTDPDARHLASTWAGLWEDVRAAVTDDTWARLAPARATAIER